jgi:hypothetical protein
VLVQPKKSKAETIVVERGDYESLYEKCWDTPEYRRNSPGERMVGAFIEAAEPPPTATLIDYGCGTGRAGYRLCKEHNLNVILVDFAKNALDDHVAEEVKTNDNLTFVKHDLREPIDPEKISVPSEFGYVTDVMEHIPEESVDAVLDSILTNSRHVFFSIDCHEDHFGWHDDIRGDKDRETLHVCVHPYNWWLKKFVDYGVVIHRSVDKRRSCLFYVTAYTGECFESVDGYLNVPPETIEKNIRYSSSLLRLGIQQIRPMETQDIEIMLVAGGPTTLDYKDEIIKQREDGMKLVTVNGAYNLVQEWGLKPSLQFLLDSRGFNKRFVEQSELTDETKFVVSSAADPGVFDLIPHDRSFIFHANISEENTAVIEECFGKWMEEAFPIPGGCTVTLRAIAALRMLGFYKIHIYGFDGCLFEDRHHAYEQKENDKDVQDAVQLTVARGTKFEKTFAVAPWHVFQAMDFRRMATKILPDVDLDIKGDGLLSYMVQTAANLSALAGVDAGVDIEIEAQPKKRAYVSRNAM